MFYHFSQNNSGGHFKEPAQHVIVEASSAAEANMLASSSVIGLYFNGVSKGWDCDCCGDRWYPQWDDEGDEVPSIYGAPITEKNTGIEWMDVLARVYYQDGQVEDYDYNGKGTVIEKAT